MNSRHLPLLLLVALAVLNCGKPPQAPAPAPAKPDPLGALVERDGRIRVKLTGMVGATTYEVSSPGGLRLVNAGDRRGSEYHSPAPLTATFQRANALQNFWRLVVAEYPPDKRLDAARHARRLEAELGAQAQVIEQPFRKPWLVGKRPPEARLCVTVGRFANREQAFEAKRLFPELAQARLMLDEHHGVTGFLWLRDKDNRVIGQVLPDGEIQSLDANAPVYLRPEPDPTTSTVPTKAVGYRGSIQLLPESDGTLLPVNYVHVEDYLLSVVPSEIGDFAPEEALRAQAVAARSEAICKLNWGNRHADYRYDFVDGQQDQVYTGVVEETSRCTAAIQATRGEVLLHDDKVIDAVYGHSCGGLSASSQEIWGGIPIPYLIGRTDYTNWRWPVNLAALNLTQLWTASSPAVYCNPHQSGFPEYARGFFRWSKDVPLERIQSLVNDRGYDIGTLKSLRVTERTPSGRVGRIEVIGSKRTITLTNGDTIRVLMGNLNSNFFHFEGIFRGGRMTGYRFNGAGFGHGVGLCQIGAYMMAKRGYGHEEILKHYFTDVRLQRLY